MRVGSKKVEKGKHFKEVKSIRCCVSALFFGKEETAADFGKRRFREVMRVEERS